MTEHLNIYEGRKILKAGALEHEVQSAIIEYLTAQKIPYSRTDAAVAFNAEGGRIHRVTEGTSDLMICLPPAGRTLACECKRAVGGVLSYEQAVFLSSVYKVGGLICIARSIECVIEVMMKGNREKDIAEVEKALAKGPDLKGKTRRRGRDAQRWNSRKGLSRRYRV